MQSHTFNQHEYRNYSGDANIYEKQMRKAQYKLQRHFNVNCIKVSYVIQNDFNVKCVTWVKLP